MHRLRTVVGFFACAAIFVGCGGDRSSGEASTSAPRELPTADPPQGEPGECAPVTPGEVLSAEQAVVTFDAGRVCTSYVTVDPTTPVTFRNESDTATVIAVHGTYPDSSGAGVPLASATVEPGEQWVWIPDAAWVYYFTLDLIPTFVGTVEAGPGGGHVVGTTAPA